LASVLKNPDIGGYDDVKVVKNEPAYKVNEEIQAFFNDRRRDDLLLLYFSCHGVKDEDGHLYYASINTRRKLLASTAISANFVNEIMARSRSRRQVLVVDCCYSGAFGRGFLTRADKKIHTGEYFEQGRGRIVLTASDSMQYSFEEDKLQVEVNEPGSIFTRAIVEGLNTGKADMNEDGLVSYDELYDYTFDRVIDEMPSQRPQKWEFGVEGDVVVAKNPHIKKTESIEDPNELVTYKSRAPIGMDNQTVDLQSSAYTSNTTDRRSDTAKVKGAVPPTNTSTYGVSEDSISDIQGRKKEPQRSSLKILIPLVAVAIGVVIAIAIFGSGMMHQPPPPSAPAPSSVNPSPPPTIQQNSTQPSAPAQVINVSLSPTQVINVGDRPSGVSVNPSTNIAYVALRNIVSVIDDKTNTVISTIKVHSPGIWFLGAVAVNPSTNIAYVVNWGYSTGDNTVFVIDGKTNTVIGTIKVGNWPRAVAVNPSTNIAYVANLDDNTVSVIDGKTNTVIGTINVGARPLGVSVNPSTNIAYVANAEDHTVSVITPVGAAAR
jgi:YVTN family beta-propeller protein